MKTATTPDDPITDETRGQLFKDLDEFLGIKRLDAKKRQEFARAHGVKVKSFAELTQGQGLKLLAAIHNSGPEGWE